MSLNTISYYIKSLNDDLKNSLTWYTNINFDSFNKKLRNNEKLSNIETSHFNNIKQIFKGAPNLNEQITVFRGVKTDTPLSSNTFISTSLNERQAMKFIDKNCCIYEITLLPGNYSVLPLDFLSINKGEIEILLPLKGSLHITHIIEASNDLQGIKRYKSIYLPNNAVSIPQHELNNLEKIHQKESKIINEDEWIQRVLKNISKQDVQELLELDICSSHADCFDELFNSLKFKDNVPKIAYTKSKNMFLNLKL